MKIISSNRKAYHNYSILDKLEAGLVLCGTEVKTLRTGRLGFSDSYAAVENGEAFLYNLDIPQYEMGNRYNHEAKRKRKLLLKKREILKLQGITERKGCTLLPLSLFFNDRSFVKVEIGIGKGKKLHDKRASEAAKEAERAIRDYK